MKPGTVRQGGGEQVGMDRRVEHQRRLKIEKYIADLPKARRMGEAGFEAARGLTWDAVVDALLGAGGLA